MNSAQPTDKITVTHLPKVTQPGVVAESYDQNGWKFTFKKSGLLPSKELDQLCDDLNLQGIPDIVHGLSIARLQNTSKNFTYDIVPGDSLSYCNLAKQKSNYKETYDKTTDLDTIIVLPAEQKIKQAMYWKDKKVTEGTEIKELAKISDWTYSTPYRGTIRRLEESSKTAEDITAGVEKLSLDSEAKPYLERTDEDIPVHNLTASNPIRWFNQIPLFEDELGDCGLSQSMFRFRVMGDCFFGLLRSYLRIDDVMIRIYDTRIYHEFAKNYIIREFSIRENSFEELKSKGFKFGAEFITNHNQSDQVYQHLDLRSTFKDKVMM